MDVCAHDIQRPVTIKCTSIPGDRKWGRILIAEDEAEVRRFLTELLHEEGYLCDCVGTAQEAVKALAMNAYDLLITDIHMPDNETLAFLQACRSEASLVPVIVMTGRPSVETAVEAIRFSVVDYLVKPVDDVALCTSVDLAIGKGRVLRSLRKTRDEMRIWSAAIDHLEKSLVAAGNSDARAKSVRPIEHVLDQTMILYRQIEASLKTMLDAMKKHGLGQRERNVWALERDQKLAVYEDALRRTVEVLMNTKSVFKSKELGDLRKMLVEIVNRETRH